MKNNYIGQAWLVLVLAIVFGSALAGVQTTLQGRINENKLKDTMTQIPNLVPDAETGVQDVIGGVTVFKAMDKGNQQVGWVIQASGQGFADVIELLVGMSLDGATITGLYVLDQKETPGLGNKIVDDDWRDQFNGQPAGAPLTVVKNKVTEKNDEIQAVTGATISSDSVVAIVNKAVGQFRAALNK
ncbi:MAG: FMN-binding protein [Spartobacteria bacterium]|nr:FMN-binding protein [Spartobacteria bacterium]